MEIDSHIGCAMSGLQADARSMVEHARVESQNHAFHYNEPLRVESCTQAICDLALRFGEGADGEESIMSRPFGVALLIAGIDEDGPQLYESFCHPFLVMLLAPPFGSPSYILFPWNFCASRLIHPAITPSPQEHFTATMPKRSARAPKVPRPSSRTNSISPSPYPRRRPWYSRR